MGSLGGSATVFYFFLVFQEARQFRYKGLSNQRRPSRKSLQKPLSALLFRYLFFPQVIPKKNNSRSDDNTKEVVLEYAYTKRSHCKFLQDISIKLAHSRSLNAAIRSRAATRSPGSSSARAGRPSPAFFPKFGTTRSSGPWSGFQYPGGPGRVPRPRPGGAPAEAESDARTIHRRPRRWRRRPRGRSRR